MKKWLHRIAGVFQIAGGFIGVIQILPTLATFDVNNLGSILSAIFLLIFLLIIGAGIDLMEGSSKAVYWSLWAQGLQIPFISFPFFAYKLIAGLDVNLYWVGMQGGLSYRLGSDWTLSIHGSNVWGIGINLFALALFILLWRIRGSSGK